MKDLHYDWGITVGKTYKPTNFHAVIEDTFLKHVILPIMDFKERILMFKLR